MPGAALGAGDRRVNERRPCPQAAYLLLGEQKIISKQIIYFQTVTDSKKRKNGVIGLRVMGGLPYQEWPRGASMGR